MANEEEKVWTVQSELNDESNKANNNVSSK